MAWDLDSIYSYTVDDVERDVYAAINLEDYDLTDENVASDIEEDIENITERVFDEDPLDMILDSALIYDRDCENILQELGIGFKEMLQLYDDYGCDTVSGCAYYAVMDWYGEKRSDMEFDVVERVKDKISEETGISF